MSYQFTEKQVDVNNHQITYVEGGIVSNSDPILFLHGWGVGLEPYQEFLNILCRRYHVIAPYLPGFGKSSGNKLDWDYKDYAKFSIDFLQTLNIPNAHLIGHSLGGGIAATVAAFMPQLVKSIILVDSTGIPVEPVPLVMAKRAVEMTAQTPQIKFPQVFQIFQGFFYNFLFNNYNTIQALMLSLTQDIKPLLSQIDSPCLLAWGSNDLTTPLRAAQEFSQLIKGSKLIVVDGVYHEWSLWFLDKFSNIVFDFIDEIEANKQGENKR